MGQMKKLAILLLLTAVLAMICSLLCLSLTIQNINQRRDIRQLQRDVWQLRLHESNKINWDQSVTG